jgi:hypothetical protein
MKKLLLSAFVLVLTGFMIAANAQQTLTLKIIETGKDGETSISFDDGEYENDSIDKLNDDDLDMGWEGEAGNIMTCFTRFQNVSIPQGSVINSAVMTVYAHEDEPDTALINVYAEDIDDSPIMTETEALSDRTMTETFVNWDCVDPWTMWQPYESPDLAPVIQEVIDRPGWEAGNSLTLFMKGEDTQGYSLLDNARDIESYENIEDPGDGGDGLWHPERIPTLVIEYTPPPGVLVLTIIETGKDGETSISFDDGEYENDSIDKLNDDDLDMGWEGEAGNVMTCFTRFQNVTIPQGANIDSAILYIYAHEDEPDTALINVYAEDIDDSPMMTETEALSDRTFTEAFVNWDCNDPWTMWEQYHSPDLAPVIQEVIDRPGWVSGNALTLFMVGEDTQGYSLLDNARDIESYENIEDPGDGGDGLWHPERIPTLKIYFSFSSSVKEVPAELPAFKMYPNPVVNGILNISTELNGTSRVNIYNITGQRVKSGEFTGQSFTLNVSDLRQGLYIIETSQGDKSVSNKLFIK